MPRDVVVTCAVTGSHNNFQKHPNFPITPKQIAVPLEALWAMPRPEPARGSRAEETATLIAWHWLG